MKKKIFLFLMAAAIVTTSLTGCGKNSSGSAAKTEEKSDAYDNGSAKTSEAEYYEEEAPAAEEYDYKEEAAEEYDYKEEAAEEYMKGSYLEECYDYGTDIFPMEGEEYSEWEEKGYSSVLKEPLSTFAADVDTASYSNLRRMIQDGYGMEDIPKGAVRIEEMLNYFTYDYQEPEGKDPFGVTTRLGVCPWNDEAELLMIGLKTENIDYEDAPPSNLVFLLDVSGSMYSDDKLPLLQEAFSMLADNLSDKDRVSIVTYAGEDTVVLSGAKGSQKRKIKTAIWELEAGGGTNGSKGIETAYSLAEENFIKGGNNRIILATDGDLNIGLTSEEELEELITEKKETGIFLSVLGFGTGNIKDNKMETLADKGNGNYAYIDSNREAKKVLVEEMSATLLTICKDVKLQVEFNPAVVSGYRLIGYENRALNKEDFNDDKKDAGEIGAGHSVTALYEILLKEPLPALSESEIEDLKYSDNYKKEMQENTDSPAFSEEWLTINIRYKKPAEEESNLLQYPVSFDSYDRVPSDDFRFAAAVAEFGLLVSHSEYAENASVAHVKKVLKEIELKDEYKEEFLELVKEIDEK